MSRMHHNLPVSPAVNRAIETVEDCIRLLGQRFRLPRDTRGIELQLKDAFSTAGGARGIAGKHLLDLGCGSPGSWESLWLRSQDPYNSTLYHPWLCRAWALCGGVAVGVDRYENHETEPFRSLAIDLFEADALRVFENASFDFVNSRFLFSSPDLVRRQRMSSAEREAAVIRVRAESRRLLKPGGKIIEFDFDTGC